MAVDQRIDFTVIIPVLNEAAALPRLLDALQDLRSRGAQVRVVDGGSVDSSVEIARDAADLILCSDAGRARQMNRGAEQAAGGFLVFLHADSSPDLSWCDALHSALHKNPAWGFFPVRFQSGGMAMRVIAFFMNLRSRVTAIGTGDQCFFVRRDVFERLGGFADQPLMEDIEICRRLRNLARPHVPTTKLAVSARRWQQHGLLRTVLLMWRLRMAYFFGASPKALHDRYYSGHSNAGRRSVARRRLLLVFAKAPVPGQVKTRLQPRLDPHQAASLHTRLLRRTLETAAGCVAQRLELYTDMPSHPEIVELAQHEGVEVSGQSGNSLGERMANALEEALEHAEHVVLIGSDCPDMTPEYLDAAFDALDSGRDVVIGPVEDGGYVLVGMRRANPVIFERIKWSSATVLEATRQRLREAGLSWQELPVLRDLDDAEDLDYFAAQASVIGRLS